VVTEAVEGVDHRGAAEGGQPLGDQRRRRPGEHREVRAQQGGGHGDGEVGLVVVGEREHPLAPRMGQAGDLQVVRVAGVTDQAGHVGTQVVQLQRVDPALLRVDDGEAAAELVERAAEQLTGLPVPGDQQERLAQPFHLAAEVLQRQRRAERPVLQQREQRTDGVGPADHGQVDGAHDPQPLRVGEGERELAEADRRGGVAHEVERVEDAHPPRLARVVLPGDERQPQDADREDQDQRDERDPHPAQDQEDRRRCLHPGHQSG
jgi:hypothetical protein